MALIKQTVSIPFATGMDQKSDPLQESHRELSLLVNGVFTKDKRIDKRLGSPALTSLPTDAAAKTLSTYQDNLLSIGNKLYSYIPSTASWLDQGDFQAISLSAKPVQRNSLSQSSQDMAYSGDGALCITYRDSDGVWRYQISDESSGQTLIAPTEPESGAVNLRCSSIGNYFIISYIVVDGSPRLRLIAIPYSNLTSPSSPVEVSNQVLGSTSYFDVYYASSLDRLYFVWEASDGGGAIRTTYMNPNLTFYPQIVVASHTMSIGFVTVDDTTSPATVWYGWVDTAGTTTTVYALTENLGSVLSPTTYQTGDTIVNITATAVDGTVRVYQQVSNTFSFSSDRADYIDRGTVDNAGTVVGPTTLIRGVGLGSKAFRVFDTQEFVAVVYDTPLQDSYYLCNSEGQVVGRWAYGNGSGYHESTNLILPSMDVDNTIVRSVYRIKDTLVPANKEREPDSVGGVFSQYGLNYLELNFAPTGQSTAEIAGNLHIAGALLRTWDGITLCEQGFNYYPEQLAVSTSTSGGSLADQDYYYQVTYEWTDSQGNLHRSAPSIAVKQTTSGGNTSTNTIDIPTLRLTDKEGVRVVIYRWSTAQPVFYQLTSISSPLLNDKTVDSVQFSDTFADASILGNPILYTTGGVIENIPAPATHQVALYRNRFTLINAEDRNSVWYSKPILQSTPVEMSDLFTLYVSPTTGAQGSTGELQALFPMDEKLLFFKANAIYYMSGQGPDSTGNFNDFTDPAFITSSVGTSNPTSLLLDPEGVQFESDKGLWRLTRSLQTVYSGFPVEDLILDSSVVGAAVVPGTTQARFYLASGKVVFYDYLFQRWGSFDQTPAVSATLYEDKPTYLTTGGEVRQEASGTYTDSVGVPVLLKFETPWYNFTGLQGFMRVYEICLLGQYITPHFLRVQIYFDYEDGVGQELILTPQQYMGTWGSNPVWGGGPVWGNGESLEQYRIFPKRQKVKAIKLIVEEIYDSASGGTAGGGLSLSGLAFRVGQKKRGLSPLSASRSFT